MKEGAIKKLIESLGPVLKEYVEGQVRPLRDAHTAALNRIKELEDRPPIPYKGIWGSSEAYKAGELVTHDGSMWFARRESKGTRPGHDPDAWVLIVKRGRDGRNRENLR